MEVYVRTEESLDATANELSEALNVRDTNRTPHQQAQHRTSANMGGEYYVFEVFGVSLSLVRNAGAMLVPERADWPFYVLVADDQPYDADRLAVFGEQLAMLLRARGVLAEVDDLT